MPPLLSWRSELRLRLPLGLRLRFVSFSWSSWGRYAPVTRLRCLRNHYPADIHVHLSGDRAGIEVLFRRNCRDYVTGRYARTMKYRRVLKVRIGDRRQEVIIRRCVECCAATIDRKSV